MKLTKIFGIVLSLHVGVILLVMFQPGCQTGGKKDKDISRVEDNVTVISESFNSGIKKDKKDTGTLKVTNEFREPSRPIAGELFVPVENEKVDPRPLPVVDEIKSQNTNEINLVPDNLTVYIISKGDTLWGIARKNNLTLENLLLSNPGLTKNSRLKIGQEIMISKSQKGYTASDQKSVDSKVNVEVGSTTYTVKTGDSLTRIAKMNGVSLSSLMIANNMSGGTIIKLGQILTIPPTESNISLLKDGVKADTSSLNTHKVKRGENLSRIAAQYGVTVREIMEWNNIIDASKIQIGQVVRISNSSISLPVDQEPNISIEKEVPVEDSKVEDFFRGVVEERPIIDVPGE
jgi:LysM repeat protein